MKFVKLCTVSGLMLVAQYSMAGGAVFLGGPVFLGEAPLGITALPLDIGGIVAIGAASLIVGAQLIKRRK